MIELPGAAQAVLIVPVIAWTLLMMWTSLMLLSAVVRLLEAKARVIEYSLKDTVISDAREMENGQ